MTLIALVALIWAFIGFCPETAAGRGLQRLLVELPARKLSSVKPATALFALVMVLVTAAAFLFLEGEALLVVAQLAPEALAWFVTFDIATYIDALAVAWILARGARLRALARQVETRVRAGLRRAAATMRRVARREPSAGPQRRAPPSANQDDEPWAVGMAMAA